MHSKSILAVALGLVLSALPILAQSDSSVTLNTSAVATFTAKRLFNTLIAEAPFLTVATKTVTWTVTPEATPTEA